MKKILLILTIIIGLISCNKPHDDPSPILLGNDYDTLKIQLPTFRTCTSNIYPYIYAINNNNVYHLELKQNDSIIYTGTHRETSLNTEIKTIVNFNKSLTINYYVTNDVDAGGQIRCEADFRLPDQQLLLKLKRVNNRKYYEYNINYDKTYINYFKTIKNNIINKTINNL